MTVAMIGMICVMSMMPGSSTAMILDMTWIHGRRMGFVTALGGSAGVAILTLFALLIGTFLSGDGLWVNIVEGVGAVYLAALGIISLIEAFATKVERPHENDSPKSSRAFVIGLLTTCLSPKTVLFYLVILSQYEFTTTSVAAGILLAGLIHIFVRLVWYGTWIHLIQPMRRLLDGPQAQRSIKVASGALLLALSIHVVF